MKGKIVQFAIFALAAGILSSPVKAEQVITADELADKMRGMWLGQLIGNAAGRSTEGDYFHSIPNPNSVMPWVIKQEWDSDDDTDIEYVAMHILESHGFDCNSPEMTSEWLRHIIKGGGIYIANMQARCLMGDGYLPPETGSRTYNEHWYSIDSQITTEVLGAVSPGLVQTAVDTAGKFACITNEGFPTHAAQLYAAMYAKAFFEPNVVTLVTESLEAIPVTSRTYAVASDVLGWYLADANDGVLDWHATRRKLYDYYQGTYSFGRQYVWLESTINAGATVLCLLYGQGDFKNTVQIGVLAGWDCDCNPATAGGLIGIIDGYSGLPSDLTDPNICGDVYKNVYRPYLPDANLYKPQYEAITSIASRLVDIAEQNILDNEGYITGSGETKTYHIPDAGAIVTEPEKPDPNGPAGLVAEAIAAGIAVTPTAAVQRYNVSKDRENLYGIIDGITDNSYNGHKAYYSYVSDPNARPSRDFYQLNFSRPVKFTDVIFYEGDIVWSGINTYYRTDSTKGGFFNDLTVEIRRDGKFFEPVGLQISPVLDRYKMYQVIDFSFAPAIGDAVRIIGTAGGTQSYTTIMELEAEGDADAGLYVTWVSVAEGQQQRSDVSEVSIRFNRDVTIAPGGIELDGVGSSTIFDSNHISFAYDDVLFQLTLSFDADGDESFGDSLPDDVYELKLDCNSIADANGAKLLDDDQNPGDGFYTIEFHRLFGDADGSAGVDLWDFQFLALRWQAGPADTGLDANRDGVVTFSDLAVFVENWLVSYSP